MTTNESREEVMFEYVDRVVDREETRTLQDEGIQVGQAVRHFVDRAEGVMQLRQAKGKVLGRDTTEIAAWIADDLDRLGRLVEEARAATTEDDL